MFFGSWNFSRLAVILPLVCLTTALGQSSSKKALVTTKPKSQKPITVTLTVEMDDAKLDSIRQTGYLRVAIPAVYRGRVDAVRLKRPVSFKTDEFQLDRSVDKLSSTVTVAVNQAQLDRLDYQPIIAKVYYSDFANVMLVYQRRKPGDPLGLAERENKPTVADSPRFYARVDEQRGLYGWIEGLATIKLKSDFGEVILSCADIAGIKFNANRTASFVSRLILIIRGDGVLNRTLRNRYLQSLTIRYRRSPHQCPKDHYLTNRDRLRFLMLGPFIIKLTTTKNKN